MASNVESSTFPSREYHCKVCDLHLDTLDSLEVHLQYHKENLYVKWGTHNSQNDIESNNIVKVKNETTVSAAADSSDNMITKQSPDFQHRGTPEITAQFTHPATPQSYHSAPSPYQNPDQTNFSPGPQFANTQYPPHSSFAQNHHSEQINWEQPQYNQDYHKPNRFHPYNVPERVSQVSSSSHLYGQPLNQPTPSPSPNQCDKCGFVCDSAIQLNEHCNSAHASSATSSAGSMPYQQFAPKHYNTGFPSDNPKVKEEQEESSDILDLDSQKVVYQGNEGEASGANFEASQNSGREVNTRTVPMMAWEAKNMYNNQQINGDVSLFKDQKAYSEQKPFQSVQKFGYGQEKFVSQHHEQKQFNMASEQKIYAGVHMNPLGEYAGAVASGNTELKPPYRPYDSPSAAPQITSTQSANSTSSALPPIGKGANWKSNEARRPKTYNCTACNKWFTSSGHLKRHYNTTLHKNAVRSSGQPDPATMPISNHHHPAREPVASRVQQQQPNTADSNTQSPAPSDATLDDSAIHSPYAATSGFERAHRPATSMNSKLPYAHLQQGNVDNNFMSNNPLANHPIPNHGTHPLNINSQPPGLGIADSNQNAKGLSTSSSGNPPNGEAGPSVTQNHHLRGLLSISTSNITTPIQNTLTPTPHTLPPFSHLAVNPYSPRSTDPLVPLVPDPTHTPIYLGQNFQQTSAPSYPNGMAPHVMDMAISNLHIASPATFGESPDVAVTESEMFEETANGRLPSFSQLQTQRFGIYISNYITTPNVGGQSIADDSTAGYIIIDPTNSPLQYSTVDVNTHKLEYEVLKNNSNSYESETLKMYPYNYVKTIKQEHELPSAFDYGNNDCYDSESQSSANSDKNKPTLEYTANNIKIEKDDEATTNNIKIQKDDDAPFESEILTYSYGVGVKTIKSYDILRTDSAEFRIVKMEDIMDYGNKENEMQSPASPESATIEYENSGSPSISSTVPGTPLVENNHIGKTSPTSGSSSSQHKCFECDKVFNKACYLTQHNKTFHSGAKPFKCKRCGKRFSDDAACGDHYSKHTDNKPFKCTQCPKSFNHKTDLRRHMCLHSGTKPFPCNSCGKGFIRKDHMLKHCETHRKVNVRPTAALNVGNKTRNNLN